MLTHLFATLIAITFGALTGLAELRAHDVQAPAVMLFCFAALAGAAYPDGAWRRAIVLGLSVPLAQAISQATGRALPYALPELAVSAFALVPAFAGTYLGVALRRLYVAQHEKHPRG